ncbi:MAG: hypothetical protein QOK25_998, partial [Thermoleophilaceae bacterium]|nr:hypothetical protein [Thermoleophilaceae bacterium]
MSYFITGATGFIGRHLVQCLLAKREGDIYVLVREASQDKLATLIEEKWGPDAQARIRPVLGDLSEPRLGLTGEQVKELFGQVDHFFHHAAVYDMTADDESNRIANVEGT